MSSAAFAQESISSSLKSEGSALRINRPDDAHEVEADQVADRVARGGQVASWSLQPVRTREVQRDPQTTGDGSPAPAKQLSAADMAGKAAEALLATKEGKAAIAAIKKDPLVKSTTDFFTTPAGIVVAGSAATAVVTGLALEHKPLPLQLPKIPLDFVHPGLSMKLSYQGPVDRPTAASLTLSFTPAGPKQKKVDPNASIQEEIRELRAQQAWIQGSMTDAAGPASVDPAVKKTDPVATTKSATPAHKEAATVPTPEAVRQKAPKAAEPGKPKQEKHEEALIQRKAEPVPEAVPTSTASVGEALHDAGRPLDPRTRGYMESRFGVNFSNVRVHTGDRAAQSARSIQARAYTVGTDIVFASGKYAPESTAGRRLLAHELTHVVQQSTGLARKPAGISHSPARVQRDGGIKGWIQDKVRSLPGYDLFCTIIGKDIATWQDKPTSMEDVLREFLKLVHAEDVWERLSKAAGAIKRAWEWFKSELVARHLTLEDFKALVEQAKDSLSASDLIHWEAAYERLKGIFKPSYDQAIDLAKLAAKQLLEIIVEFVMENFGDTGKQVLGFLKKAGDTITTIAHDPIKFVGNLVDAVKLGFKNFAGNFLKHLQDSLMEFLFGEVGSRIKPPKSFSLPAIFQLVLDVLELNYPAFRERLVAKTSPEAVTFLEGAYDTITKMASAKSLSAAWDVFSQQAGNLINMLVDTAIDKIKSWVMNAVVQKAIEKVLEMFTPASAVIAAIEAIYHTIVTLINKGKQLLEVLQATVDSIARIASGDLTQAAQKIEGAMAKAMNFLVAFFAEQAGVGGIGQTIRDIIKAIKDKVWGVIDKVIDYVVGKASGLLARAKAAAGKVLAWWQQRKDLMVGGQMHSIYMEGTEDDPHLMIASTPTTWADYLAEKTKHIKGGPQKKQVDRAIELVTKLEKKLDKKQGYSEGSDQVKQKRADFEEVCKIIAALGLPHDALPKSVFDFADALGAEQMGQRATAKILTAVHESGSGPSEDAPIWETLKPIRNEKNYVRGHLLNDNLGGPGLNKNLTPINKKANTRHRVDVEDKVKKLVLTEKKIVFYQVQAVYDKRSDADKPKPMVHLEELEAKQTAVGADLPMADKERLEAYRAEQKLATRFDCEWYEEQLNEKGEVEEIPSTHQKVPVENVVDKTK